MTADVRKVLTVRVDPELHRSLVWHARITGKPTNKIVEALLIDWWNTHGLNAVSHAAGGVDFSGDLDLTRIGKPAGAVPLTPKHVPQADDGPDAGIRDGQERHRESLDALAEHTAAKKRFPLADPDLAAKTDGPPPSMRSDDDWQYSKRCPTCGGVVVIGKGQGKCTAPGCGWTRKVT